MSGTIIIPGEPEPQPTSGERKEVHVDVTHLPEHMEVVIKSTGKQIERTAGAEIKNAQSLVEAKEEVEKPIAPETADVVEPEVASVEESTSDPLPEPVETKEAEEIPVSGKPKRKFSLKKFYENDKFAARSAAGVGALSMIAPFIASSSVASMSLSTLGLTGLALSLPYLAYKDSDKGKKFAGTMMGVGGSAAIYGFGGTTLQNLATLGSSIALPVGLAYGGYKLGKRYKRPVAGALTGAAGGMALAPMVSGAITGATGGGWAAASSAAAGLSGLGWPLAFAAGTYGAIKLGKYVKGNIGNWHKNWKEKRAKK